MRRITLGEDGKYRWSYELHLLKNPVILFLIWKIMFWIFFGIWVFVVLCSMNSPHFWWAGFLKNLKFFAIFVAAMLALCFLGYLLYAALMGWKYKVEFVMDENGVVHTQEPMQAKKARTLSLLTALAGLLSKNPTTVGVGLNASAKTSSTSEFSKVKRMKVLPRMHTIKLNAPLNKNQVYADGEDFQFVLEYISQRVPASARK